MQRLQSLHAGLVRQFRQALVRSMSTDSAAVVESSTSSSALTGRQEHVRFITPQNSRRNFARRLLARQLQVARNARERQVKTAKALEARDAKRVQRWTQRAAWRAEAAAESA